MNIIITEKTDIKGKDKREWAKVSYIRVNDGSVGTLIIPKATFEEFDISSSDMVDAKVYEEFVKNSPVLKGDFDDRGRLIAINK